MSSYILGPDADLDLDDIWEYIARDSIDAAGRWIGNSFDAFEAVVARSPDRATGPTEGLHTLTLPGCPLAWQEAGWRYNHNVERYRIHADAAVYYLTYSVPDLFGSRMAAGVRVSGELSDRDREPELLSSRQTTPRERLRDYAHAPAYDRF